jgi:hypothetical protein
METWCFKCHANREIMDPKWTVTRNNRNLCKGKCIECYGNVALMSGYASLPDTQFGKYKGRKEERED